MLCYTVQVQKTKACDLKKWLQENGVKSRSRDKKDDLVRQVVAHIKETGKTLNLYN